MHGEADIFTVLVVSDSHIIITCSHLLNLNETPFKHLVLQRNPSYGSDAYATSHLPTNRRSSRTAISGLNSGRLHHSLCCQFPLSRRLTSIVASFRHPRFRSRVTSRSVRCFLVACELFRFGPTYAPEAAECALLVSSCRIADVPLQEVPTLSQACALLLSPR